MTTKRPINAARLTTAAAAQALAERPECGGETPGNAVPFHRFLERQRSA
jgi:hypothetical protein